MKQSTGKEIGLSKPIARLSGFRRHTLLRTRACRVLLVHSGGDLAMSLQVTIAIYAQYRVGLLLLTDRQYTFAFLKLLKTGGFSLGEKE